MRTTFRTAIFLVALIWPLALSAAPSSIKNLSAQFENGVITLKWNPPAQSDHVAYYRVYYSQRSILGNKGTYDDYERTKTADPTATLKNFPPQLRGGTLYVAVLAVDEQGKESPTFTEEVAIGTGVSDMPPREDAAEKLAESSTLSSGGGAAAMLEVLSVRALSETGVVLTFSDPVLIPPKDAGRAFSITDASGASLRITRIRVTGPAVLLETAPQKKGRVYEVRIGDVVQGLSASSKKAMPLNIEKSTILVMGFDGKGPVTAPKTIAKAEPPSAKSMIPSSTTTSPSEVSDLTLDPQADAGGTYTVTAQWQSPLGGALGGYSIRQSFNGSKKFGPAQSVDAAVRRVQFTGLRPGIFTVSVRSVGTGGLSSRGVLASVTLRPTNQPSQPTPPKDLSTSGPGTLLALLGAGAVMGWRRMKRP